MNHLYVGTSGYRYWPGDVFPPKTSSDDALRMYSQELNSLELNRTFYQLPRASSIVKWQALVPPGYVWSVKIWRLLSHEQKLLDISKNWSIFLARLSPLILPQGIFLLQLPKSFPFEPSRLEAFFEMLPKGLRLAVEFRQDAWFVKTIYKLLERYGVALVGVGAPGVPCVLDVRTAPYVYYRLHGPRAWYKDRYSAGELQPFINAARTALRHGDVYTYFDNTIGGHAYWNAKEFFQAVESGAASSRNLG